MLNTTTFIPSSHWQSRELPFQLDKPTQTTIVRLYRTPTHDQTTEEVCEKTIVWTENSLSCIKFSVLVFRYNFHFLSEFSETLQFAEFSGTMQLHCKVPLLS